MSRYARNVLYLIPALVLYMLPVFAVQEAKGLAPAEALKRQVMSYYETLKKGQKAAALDFVAPESKNDFAYMNNEGLVDFRILDVHLAETGDKATVSIERKDNFPGFPQVLKRQTVDNWKQLDGKWYVLLPAHKENEVLDTPFGKMTFTRGGENNQQAPPQLPEQKVSPEEAKQALQRAVLEANKKKSSDRDKKPEDKKSDDQAAPKPNPPN